MAYYIIQFKRGKAATLERINPVLEDGEPCFEIDTGRFKLGRDKKHWLDLPYVNGSGSISPDGQSLVTDVNGVISIYGYQDAKIGQIPVKTAEGLKWISLSKVAETGKVEDLTQTETIEFFGGSATELI